MGQLGLMPLCVTYYLLSNPMQNPCVESISCQVSCMHLEHADYILYIKKKKHPAEAWLSCDFI